MSRTVLASIFLSVFFAAPLYADSTAPAPGVTAEAQISDADLAAEIKRLGVKPPQNGAALPPITPPMSAQTSPYR